MRDISNQERDSLSPELEVRSFTATAQVSQATQIQFSASFWPSQVNHAPSPPELAHIGIFDTGATCTVISRQLADDLRLPIVDRCLVGTAGGTVEQSVHYVDVRLPSGIFIPTLRVVAAPLPGMDFLLGMDIISKGDTLLVSRQGFMVLTFTMYFHHGRVVPPNDILLASS